MKHWRFLPLAIIAWLGSSCGGDPSGPNGVAADIVVVPSQVDIDQLEHVQLSAYVVDKHGDKVPGAGLKFKTNTPTLLSVSASGRITADGFAGNGDVTVSFGTLARTIPVTVHPVATRIAVFPGSDLTLPTSAVTPLTVVVYDATDLQMFGLPYSIATSAPSIVDITAFGEAATSGTTGNATLSVQSGGLHLTVHVQVADFHRQTFAGEPFGVAVSTNDVAYIAAISGPMGRVNLPGFTIASQVPVLATSVTFSASGTTAYIAGYWNSGIPVVDVATDSVTDSLGSFEGTRFAVLPSADGQKVFVGNSGGLVALSVATGATTVLPVGSYVNHLSRHPTLPLLYATQPDLGRIAEINTTTNAIVRTFTPPPGMLQATAVSANGNRLFIANESGEMDIWDLVGNTALPPVKNVGNPFGLSLSPDGSKIYLSGPGAVRVIDAVTLHLLTVVVTGGVPRAVAFNQAGTVAVSANEAGWVDFLP